MAVNEELNKQYKEQLKSVQALERFTVNITSQQKAQLKAEKAKLATIEKRIEADMFYNFICGHTDNEAYYCSDEADYDLNYVVCVNINMIDSDKHTSELLTMKTEQVC